jgi:hypothetical protein
MSKSRSPIFRAQFADGEVMRMTVSTPLDKLDIRRGVRLSIAAYESRKKQKAPAIVGATFEGTDAHTLATYIPSHNNGGEEHPE